MTEDERKYDEGRVWNMVAKAVGKGHGDLFSEMLRDYAREVRDIDGMMERAYEWATSDDAKGIDVETGMAAWIVENESRHVQADIEWNSEEFRHRALEDSENTQPNQETISMVSEDEDRDVELFRVFDKLTGKDVTEVQECERIALNSKGEERNRWAQHLVWCDMEGWLVDTCGGLYLADECGNWECAPEEQYEVRLN